MALYLTTTVTTTITELVDANGLPTVFTHPTVDFILTDIWLAEEITIAASLQAAINSGAVIVRTVPLGGGTVMSNIISASSTSGVVIDNLLFVSTNGSDTNGDGSINYPYASLVYAASVAVSGDQINVTAGTYVETNPIVIPSGVAVTGDSDDNVVITPLSPNLDLFSFNLVNVSLSHFTMSGVLGASCISQSGTTTSLIIRGISFENSQSCIVSTGGTITVTDTKIKNIGTYGTIISCTNAMISVSSFTVETGVTATTVIYSSGSHIDISMSYFDSLSVTRIIDAVAGSLVETVSTLFHDATNGIRLNTASGFNMTGGEFNDIGLIEIEVIDLASTIKCSGIIADRAKIIFPTNYTNDVMTFVDLKTGDQGYQVWGDLSVGRAERGSESVFGEGDSYTRGIVVLTTDGTATSTTDGGTFIDASTAATDPTIGTLTFQGVTANHCILIGSSLSDANGVIKHWGTKIDVATGGVNVLPKSYVIELWNGAAWVNVGVMATDSSAFTRYGNEILIRANSEHMRYGITSSTPWATKLINGHTLYWTRIRIVNTVTSAPIFNQIKLHSSRSEINGDGTHTFHGNSRYRQSLLFSGNIFGESGGVSDGRILIGSGLTSWTHTVKNSQLNVAGDAVYFLIQVPNGVDTSMPLNATITYSPTIAGASTNATLSASIIPMEVVGINIASATGSVAPTPRLLPSTNSILTNTGVANTLSAPMVDNTKLQSKKFSGFSIVDYYEHDVIAFKVGLDATGSANKGVVIWGVDISAVFWTHGEKL